MNLSLYELFDNVDAILRAHGFRVSHIRYPDEPSRRSIDVIAVSRDKEILVKVVEDVKEVSSIDIRELNACSNVLDTSAVIVAGTNAGEEIDEMVALEKGGAYIVGVEGLRSALQRSVYVIRKQNNYYMRIDGRRLRERRIEKGYSLGDVASYLSVSRRSVYLYEQEESLVSLPVALKLMEVFGEDIFKPFDIISREERPSKKEARIYTAVSQSASKSQLARLLASIGYSVAATRRIPPDIVAGRVDSSGKKRLMIIIERKREKDLERRVEEAVHVAAQLEAEVVAVSKRKEIAASYNVEVIDTARKLEEVIGKERLGSGDN